MRKIGLARLGVARKGNPCPSMSMLCATMVAIVATKHTLSIDIIDYNIYALRQCGARLI